MQLLHKGTIVVTGFCICCGWRVAAIFGAQILELLEGGFFVWSEMANVTFESDLDIGSFWGWRAGGRILVLCSVHLVNNCNSTVGMIMSNSRQCSSKQAVYISLESENSAVLEVGRDE